MKDLIFNLSNSDAAGEVSSAADFAFNELSKYAQTERFSNLNIIGFLKGNSDYTLMLDAHIDQISMVVTKVSEEGFVTVAAAGGIDLRQLPSKRVIIHSKEKILGVFSSIPPHLSKADVVYDDLSKLKIDTGLKNAKEIISVGDVVTFKSETFDMENGLICGKSFDNRASVAVLLKLAEKLKGKELPFNVAFVLSDGEELGLRGVRTAAYKVTPNEAIVLDVTFGNGVGISPDESGVLGKGGMIGISPVLDRKISNKLINIAEQNGIPYAIETMSEKTGTNADMVSISKEGVPTATLSIPIRNMHTDCEILDLNDVKSVFNMIYNYVLGGGIMND